MPTEESEPIVDAEEYKRAQTTEQFIREITDAEKNIDHFPTHFGLRQDEQGVSINRGSGATALKEWPDERAHSLAKALTEVPDSGIDMNAANKVRSMKDEAEKVNRAHDVVTSDGANTEPLYDEARIQRRLKGNNQIGPSIDGLHEYSQQRGAMARGSNRKYDIKDGVAMRGMSNVSPDKNDNVDLTKGEADSTYKPFAPQHQEAAKKAMRSLAEKQMRRANELERQKEVKAAKAVLGRAGMKIPKPQASDKKEIDENDQAA